MLFVENDTPFLDWPVVVQYKIDINGPSQINSQALPRGQQIVTRIPNEDFELSLFTFKMWIASHVIIGTRPWSGSFWKSILHSSIQT